MNKHQAQEKKELLTWDTDYNGSAIYSLVDENGKRYIGQAKHLQHRLWGHRSALRRALNGNIYYSEGAKLVEAVQNGTTFKVEVLKMFPDVYEVARNTLAYWEQYYLDKYGGIEGTYNGTYAMPINKYYEPFNKDITWEEYAKAEKTRKGTIKKKRSDKPKSIGHISVCLWLDESEIDIYNKLKESSNKELYIKQLIRGDIAKGGDAK